jgi:hypothetical protein
MTFRARGRYKCDGCKVLESDDIEMRSELMRADVPLGWLRVDTYTRTRMSDAREIYHFCEQCRPVIENDLEGRNLGPDESDELDLNAPPATLWSRPRS